ncbi:hypothetical protein M885DRAFT_570775 [Pelagophyceae sp. CCMP2097]|nr:hypothetical protein M885DRAFT_570775 [Pelagophyceae sp. CCMP2097]
MLFFVLLARRGATAAALPKQLGRGRHPRSTSLRTRLETRLETAQLRGGSLWSEYQTALQRRPILTKASCVGFAISDVLTQCCVERGAFSARRLLKMASFGLLLHGTTGHCFYGFLDAQLRGTTPQIVALKVAIDQTLWAPTFMTMFFTYMPELIASRLRQGIIPAMQGSWVTWIPAHTINFAFVPPSQRLLYINVIQVFFNVFMSIIGNKDVE